MIFDLLVYRFAKFRSPVFLHSSPGSMTIHWVYSVRVCIILSSSFARFFLIYKYVRISWNSILRIHRVLFDRICYKLPTWGRRTNVCSRWSIACIGKSKRNIIRTLSPIGYSPTPTKNTDSLLWLSPTSSDSHAHKTVLILKGLWNECCFNKSVKIFTVLFALSCVSSCPTAVFAWVLSWVSNRTKMPAI